MISTAASTMKVDAISNTSQGAQEMVPFRFAVWMLDYTHISGHISHPALARELRYAPEQQRDLHQRRQ